MTTIADDLPVIPPYFVYGAVASFATYYFSFWLVEKVLLPKYASPTLRAKLALCNEKDHLFFLTCFPSSVHAVVQCFGLPSYLALGYSEPHNRAKIAYYDEYWPAFFQGFFAGYMLADLVKCGVRKLGATYTIHHVASFAAWTLSSYWRSMQWYGAMLQFCEFSTLFMNLRQYLLTSGHDEGSGLMTAVNFLFFLSFGAVRVAPLPMILKHWFSSDGYTIMRDKNGDLNAVLTTGFILIHTGLQTMWFSMMLKKLAQVILGGGGASKGSKTKKGKLD